MEDDIQKYSSTFMFRGTPFIIRDISINRCIFFVSYKTRKYEALKLNLFKSIFSHDAPLQAKNCINKGVKKGVGIV